MHLRIRRFQLGILLLPLLFSGCYTVLFHPDVDSGQTAMNDCAACHTGATAGEEQMTHLIWRSQMALESRTYHYSMFHDYPWWYDHDVARIMPGSRSDDTSSATRTFTRDRRRAYETANTGGTVTAAPVPAVDENEPAFPDSVHRGPQLNRRRR